MNDPKEDTTPVSFWDQLGEALLWLFKVGLRLLVVIVLGAVIGGFLYWGAMLLYQRYVASVQENQLQLAALANRQAQDSQQLGDRLDSFAERLEALEGQGDAVRESLAELAAQVEVLETGLAAQAALPDDLESAQAQIADLEDSLDRVSATQSASLADLQADLTALEEDIVELSTAMADLDQTTGRLSSALGGENAPGALRAELGRLRVLGLLVHSRLMLSQGNYSVAQSDLQLAGEGLTALVAEASAIGAQRYGTALTLLAAAAESLPDDPVAAVDALDGAWQLLLEADLGGASSEPEEGAADIIPAASPAGTPTPGGTPGPTGTPQNTPTPTP